MENVVYQHHSDHILAMTPLKGGLVFRLTKPGLQNQVLAECLITPDSRNSCYTARINQFEVDALDGDPKQLAFFSTLIESYGIYFTEMANKLSGDKSLEVIVTAMNHLEARDFESFGKEAMLSSLWDERMIPKVLSYITNNLLWLIKPEEPGNFPEVVLHLAIQAGFDHKKNESRENCIARLQGFLLAMSFAQENSPLVTSTEDGPESSQVLVPVSMLESWSGTLAELTGHIANEEQRTRLENLAEQMEMLADTGKPTG